MKQFLEGVEVLSVFTMCLGASVAIAFGILHTIIRLTSSRQYNEADAADIPYAPSRRTLSTTWLRSRDRNLASR
jgi:hypothetical protein